MQNADFIDLLHRRVSCGQLEAPAPAEWQLDAMFKAAFRAADHAQLRPWRFLVIEGEGLDKLGAIFVQAEEAAGKMLDEKARKKALAKPRRAPMIVVAIETTKPHDKVPEIEQILSAGAAVQNMLNAAFALGVGAMAGAGDFKRTKEGTRQLLLTGAS